MICVQSLIEICLRRLLFSEGKCLDGGKNLLIKSIEYIIWWWVYSEVYCSSDLRLSPTDKLEQCVRMFAAFTEMWNVFDWMRRVGKKQVALLFNCITFQTVCANYFYISISNRFQSPDFMHLIQFQSRDFT